MFTDLTSHDVKIEQTMNLWFLRMRWAACLVAVVLIVMTIKVLGALEDDAFWPLIISVVCLFLSNLIYIFLMHRNLFSQYFQDLQIGTDLVILTSMLHFSGGIENAMFFAYAFHIIIAGIMLDKWKCYATVIAASVLFGIMAFAEMSEVIKHYTLTIFPHVEGEHKKLVHAAHRPIYVSSVIVVQFLLMSLTAYFTTTIMSRLRMEEKRVKKVEAEMIHSSRMASLGLMAAGIAHEIGNPLASISTQLHLLGKNPNREYVEESLQLLYNQVGRISKIVGGISRIARPASDEWTSCQVNEIVNETIRVLEPHGIAKKTPILTELAPDLPKAMAVKDQLIQVFLNLELNALQAMPDGGTLTIRTYSDSRDIRIGFKDTGKGMNEDVQSKIFDPFFTTKDSGIGLGLWIVHKIMDSHGGRIDVVSSPVGGTEFIVVLPIGGPDSPGSSRRRSNVC